MKAPAEPCSSDLGATQRNGVNILKLVEDTLDVISLVMSELQCSGITVTWTKNGKLLTSRRSSEP